MQAPASQAASRLAAGGARPLVLLLLAAFDLSSCVAGCIVCVFLLFTGFCDLQVVGTCPLLEPVSC